MKRTYQSYYHPLYTYVLVYVLGIVAEYYLKLDSFIVLIFFLSIGLSICYFFLTSFKIHLPFLLLTGIVGFCNAYYQKWSFFEFYHTHKKITILGTVLSIEKLVNKTNTYNYTIQVERIRSQKQFLPCRKRIRIYTGPINNLQVADKIKIYGVDLHLSNNDSFNHFLIKEGLLGTAFIRKKQLSVIERPNLSLRRWIFNTQQKLCTTIQQKTSPTTYALFSSLFMGNRQVDKKIITNVADYFKYWGISHYLARSGLHLVIFIFLWNFFLGLIPCYFWIKQCLLLLITFIYYIMSWSSTSFLRALSSFLVHKFCAITKYRVHNIYLIVLIFFLYLIKNPAQLFCLDFQLSFGLTFGLLWIGQFLAAKQQND